MSARHLRAARLATRQTLKSLPARLPEGEKLLWQGAPRAGVLLRRMFHLRLVAAYFATILALSAASAAGQGPHRPTRLASPFCTARCWLACRSR